MRSRRRWPAIVVTVLVAGTCVALAHQAAPAGRQPAAFTADDLMNAVRILASPEMEGRRTGTPGNAKAREWIQGQLSTAGLRSIGERYQGPFVVQRRQQGVADTADVPGVNLTAMCQGTGAKDQGLIAVTAHYDHLGVRDGAIYHGADDNASGVAVLLALARQCARTPFTHDVLFVAFDGEEMGLQGARAFVAQPPLPKERLAININLDMVARGDKGELYIAGTSHTPSLRAILEPVVKARPIKVLFGHDSGGGENDWTSQSDHGAFHGAGIPFLYFGVEDHPDYHKPTDTADKIDPAFFYQSALTVLEALRAVDRALPLPGR